MSTLDLVSAIINKDATAIESSFNDVMAEKISARLDDMRTTVAQSMFKTEEPETVVEEEFVSEEELEEAKKKWKKMCEEGSISEEELEEYNRLDEISKELATKYSNKVVNKAVKKEFPTKDSKKDLPSYMRKDIAINRLPQKRKEGVARAMNRTAHHDYYNTTKAMGGNQK